jgi:hypothetical protein
MGTDFHAVPFQCSVKVPPTAQALVAETAEAWSLSGSSISSSASPGT